jgi:hypothetical protein
VQKRYAGRGKAVFQNAFKLKRAWVIFFEDCVRLRGWQISKSLCMVKKRTRKRNFFKFAPPQTTTRGREKFCARVRAHPIWRALLFSFSFFLLHRASRAFYASSTTTAKLLLLLLLLYLATFMLFYVYFNCKARSKRTRASIFLSSHSRRDDGIFFAARWCCCCERFLLAFKDSSSRKRRS